MGKISNRKMDDQPKDSAEKIRGWLYAIIENELNKDEEQIDYELIQECSDLDAYLTGNESPLSEEEYQQALQQIRSKTMTKQTESSNSKVVSPKKTKRWSIRVALVAAAVLVVMFSAITVAAISQGRSVSEFISANIKEFLGLDIGDSIEGENITLIKGETTAEYSSIEEAVNALELDILYPTAMPKDAKVEKIILTNYGDPDIYTIVFIANKPDEYRFQISNEILTNPQNWQNATKHEINGVTFYMLPVNGGYQAVAHQNGFEYQVFATNMDDLLIIVNEMKGLK